MLSARVVLSTWRWAASLFSYLSINKLCKYKHIKESQQLEKQTDKQTSLRIFSGSRNVFVLFFFSRKALFSWSSGCSHCCTSSTEHRCSYPVMYFVFRISTNQVWFLFLFFCSLLPLSLVLSAAVFQCSEHRCKWKKLGSPINLCVWKVISCALWNKYPQKRSLFLFILALTYRHNISQYFPFTRRTRISQQCVFKETLREIEWGGERTGKEEKRSKRRKSCMKRCGWRG